MKKKNTTEKTQWLAQLIGSCPAGSHISYTLREGFSQQRNLKTLAQRSSVDRKHFEMG